MCVCVCRCDFFTSPYSDLGHVLNLTVSIPYLCLISYFDISLKIMHSMAIFTCFKLLFQYKRMSTLPFHFNTEEHCYH